MTVADGTMGDERLDEARRSLNESQAAAAADAPLLELADRVILDMRQERMTNNWARRVQVAFQATRGTA